MVVATRRRLLGLAAGVLMLVPSCRLGGGSQAVSFLTRDGFHLAGELGGTGLHGIILVQPAGSPASSWGSFGGGLASRGYRVLTFEYRGHGGSQGEADTALAPRDVEAAVRFMHDRIRTTTLVLVGAGTGGTAAMVAAAAASVSAVAVLSAPETAGPIHASAPAGLVTAPKLFIAASADPQAHSMEVLYEVAADPRTITFVPGSEHGAAMIDGSHRARVRGLLMRFLRGSSR